MDNKHNTILDFNVNFCDSNLHDRQTRKEKIICSQISRAFSLL